MCRWSPKKGTRVPSAPFEVRRGWLGGGVAEAGGVFAAALFYLPRVFGGERTLVRRGGGCVLPPFFFLPRGFVWCWPASRRGGGGGGGRAPAPRRPPWRCGPGCG